MPGTIRVSVLDLLDLPSSTTPSSTTLKVAMGKREFQTVGKGVFSFSLTNLRENLLVSLLDEEGSEISRTVIETISVVEKGCWDELFQLECGGTMHLLLQLELSEVERKRVQDVRESVLKRKRQELGKISLSRSESESEDHLLGSLYIGEQPYGSSSFTSSILEEHSQEGLAIRESLADLLHEAAPDAIEGSLTAASQEVHFTEHPPEVTVKENHSDPKRTVDSALPFTNVFPRNIVTVETVDPEQGCSGPTISDKLIKTVMPISVKSEECRSEGLKGNAQKNISSIVRNMISAFESSPAQVQRPDVNLSAKSQLRKLERKGFSVQNAKNPISYSQSTQCPKFSEPLFEDKPEGRYQYVLSTRGEMKGKNNSWFTMSGNNETIIQKEDKGIRIINDKNLLETSVFDTTSCIPQRTNVNLESFNLEEKISVGDSIESLKQGQQPLLSQVQTGCYITSPSIIHSESDGKNFSDASGKRPSCPSITDSVSSDEQIIHKVADNDISSGNIESTLTENRTIEWFKARTQMLDQLLDLNHQKSVHGVVSETRKWRDFRNDVDKLTTCIPLHKNGNIPSLPAVEHYLLENPGGWIPVHLCYTTASNKLRSLIEENTIQAGTRSLEKHFSQRAAAEPQMLDDGCILMKNETSGSYRNTTIQSLLQVPKISGALIQQGVRFVAIVVCGAILFKTRQ